MNSKTVAAIAAIGLIGATVALVDLPPSESTPDAGGFECARRRPGADCWRLDGGDPGEWNRYASGLLTGDCEPVVCTVLAGEDSEK